MAKDTFLQLVSDVIMETGLNGGNAPSDVEGATGDAKKVVYWVQTADAQIQRERIDWDFLWSQETVNLLQSSAIVPTPSSTYDATNPNAKTELVNAIAKDRLAIIDANGQSYFPSYMKWDQFTRLYSYDVQPITDFPAHWSIRPDRVLVLSNPIESIGMSCKYEVWKKPIKMRVSADVSAIPDDFSRLIVLLAKILYAEHEDAPEVGAGALAHYDVVFNQMLSVHTPESEWQRMENSDQFLQVETR
jgi:hypothetical protein